MAIYPLLLCSGFHYAYQDLSDHLFTGTWAGEHLIESSNEGYIWTLHQKPDHSLVIHFTYLEQNISIIEYGTWEVIDGVIFHHIQQVQVNEKPVQEKKMIFDYKILSITPDKFTYQSERDGESVVYQAIRKP